MPSKPETIGGLCLAMQIGLAAVTSVAAGERHTVPDELALVLNGQDGGNAEVFDAETAPLGGATLRLETFKDSAKASPGTRHPVDAAALDGLLDLHASEENLPKPPEKRPRSFSGILASGAHKDGKPKGNTLAGVLAKALAENQELAAARAQFRAVSEQLPQARAALLPNVSGTASATAERSWEDSTGGAATDGTSIGYGLELKQVLFDGFRGINNMAAARAQIEAERKAYMSLVQAVLLNTATAYMSVLRDRRVVDLRRQNLAFVDEQLRSAKVRFEIGEGTVTDVAQSESQRALALSLLESALADVAASEATYEEILGAAPGKLEPLSVKAMALPETLKASQQRAEQNNPSIQAALHAAEAASSKIRSSQAGLLPSIDLTASVKKEHTDESDGAAVGLPGVRLNRQEETNASVGVKLTVPFYQGGRVVSEIRQARETYDQRRIEAGRARSRVLAATATAWARLKAARQNVKNFSTRLQSAQIALDGVAEEQQIGQRTTLDVLNAQAELIATQIQLIEAERTLVISTYSLLAAMGEIPG